MPALASSRPFHPAGRGPDLRPSARPTRLRRRLGHQLATGLTPAQAARAEGVDEAEVQAFLAQPLFATLVEGYRALAALPEAEARRRLIARARFLLDEAITEGDVRAAAFVLVQENRDRDPARVLADGVLARHRQAAAPVRPSRTAAPSAEPTASRPPTHPADRMERRIAAALRDALLVEQAMVEAAAPAAPEPPAVPAPALNRRQRRRQAAQERRARPAATLPSPPKPRDGRPAPRSRGP